MEKGTVELWVEQEFLKPIRWERLYYGELHETRDRDEVSMTRSRHHQGWVGRSAISKK